MKIKLLKIANENKSYLIAESIFNQDIILQEIESINDYEIIKKCFPLFDETVLYELFEVFPYFNSDIKITGIGKEIKLLGIDVRNISILQLNKVEVNDSIHELIQADFLHLFKNNIPYRNILYL